ncbi:MAG TPA: hypothetical protein VFV34_24875 [Blastocatellia bacterium]|nr:hypothetical protein [Blastocatellia bacterium]
MFILTTLKRVLFWSYERGTWQYDVMCVLILAFIFAGPNSLFQNEMHRQGAGKTKIEIGRGELNHLTPAQIKAELEKRASEKEGHQVSVNRYEVELDDAGDVKAYEVVWQPDPK